MNPSYILKFYYSKKGGYWHINHIEKLIIIEANQNSLIHELIEESIGMCLIKMGICPENYERCPNALSTERGKIGLCHILTVLSRNRKLPKYLKKYFRKKVGSEF